MQYNPFKTLHLTGLCQIIKGFMSRNTIDKAALYEDELLFVLPSDGSARMVHALHLTV